MSRAAKAGSDIGRPRVALVYPPFAPAWIPSLGLGILSAGIKQLGFDCRTFYWNLRLLDEFDGGNFTERLEEYDTAVRWFPWNEWIFSGDAFPDFHPDRQIQALNRLEEQSERQWANRDSQLADLRRRAPELVDRMVDLLAEFDIVGISSVFWQNLAAIALARRLKRRWPEKAVVLGGANCEGEMGKTQLECFPFVDYVFSGEVDFSFPEFVRRVASRAPVEDLPGIVYRKAGGEIAAGPTATPLQEMDRLPFPDYDDYFGDLETIGQLGGWRPSIALESSRGCWWGAKHHCTFCGLNALGMAYREKSAERFLAEVDETTRRYETNRIVTTDNILSMSYLNGFVDSLKQRRRKYEWYYETKSNLTRAQVDSLAEAGIKWLQPGIESFSTPILKQMNKGATGIQQVALIKYAEESDVRLNYAILAGFPGEEPGEYEAMARRIRALTHLQPPSNVNEIMYERFSPYHRDPERYGLDLRPNRGYSILYPLPEDVLMRLVYHFERRDLPTFPYLDGIRHELARWKRAYGEGASLSWRRDGAAILIRDGRPGFARRDYLLEECAVPVLLAMDRPRTLAAIGREIGKRSDDEPAGGAESVRRRLGRLLTRARSISFSRDDFLSAPEASVEPFVDAGIVYVEGDRYLSLPVSRKRECRPGASC